MDITRTLICTVLNGIRLIVLIILAEPLLKAPRLDTKAVDMTNIPLTHVAFKINVCIAEGAASEKFNDAFIISA